MCTEVADSRMNWVKEIRESVKPLLDTQMIDKFDVNGDAHLDRAEVREALIYHDVQLLGRKAEEPEVDLLLCFLELADNGTLHFDDLLLCLTIWHMCEQNWETWEAQFESGHLTTRHLWNLMLTLNKPSKVALHEAEWVLEMASTFCTVPDLKMMALGLALSYWMISMPAPANSGIHRERFIERLQIESHLETGILRLLNLIVMFFLITEAFQVTGQASKCRGIKDTLFFQYKLEEVTEITSLDGVRSFMSEFSKNSQDLAVLSASYFMDGSEWQLVEGVKEYSEPERLPIVDLLMGEAFSLQAWVQLDRSLNTQPPGLSILRKHLSDDAAGSQLSCWRWSFPPSISYGAHDYGGSGPNANSKRLEEYVSVPYPEPYNETEDMVLHTLVVNRTHAKFMTFSDTLGIVQLKRPITDCISPIITLGDEGLTLGEVRFWPRALADNEVEDIVESGGIMTETGFTNPPLKMEPLTKIELISLDVENNKKTMVFQGEEQKNRIDAAAALVPPAVLRPKEKPRPYSNTNMTIPVRSDPTLGFQYWEIVGKPVFVDASSKTTFMANQLPPITDSGFTISAWLKSSGLGYLMSESYPSFADNGDMYYAGWATICWFAWVGQGTYMTFRMGLPGDDNEWTHSYNINDHLAPSAWRWKNKAYRHFTFRLDPKNETHPLLICIDGACGGDFIDNEPKPGQTYTNCKDKGFIKAMPPELQQKTVDNIIVNINSRQPFAWQLEAHEMNFKYFNRSLSDAQIRKLFEEDPDPEDPDRRPIRKVRGCKTLDEMADDPIFKDDFGNDCFWYFQSRLAGSNICERMEAAKRACPIACESAETCWGSYGTDGVKMQIWDQQMEIRSKGPWGTVCLGKSTTAEQEAIKCGLNAPNHTKECEDAGLTDCKPRDCSMHAGDSAKVVECLGDLVWISRGVDTARPFMPCADIIRLHEPTCDWDDSNLDKLSLAINESGQWAGQFWFEAFRENCIQPQFRLMNGWGHVFSYIGQVAYHTYPIADPEADLPLGTGCPGGAYLTHVLLGDKSQGYKEMTGFGDLYGNIWTSPGARHLFTFGVKDGGPFGRSCLQLDTERDCDTLAGGPIGYNFEGKDFLRVINVIGDIRMSPWTLQAWYPTIGEITQRWYDEQVLQNRKRGPARTLAQQFGSRRKRSTARFTRKTTLVTPPLAVLVRRKAGECILDFSDKVIEQYVLNAKNLHCRSPYECNPTNSEMYQCPAEEDEQEKAFFGLSPEEFEGKSVYVELLSTIADHAVVVRNQDGRRSMLSTRDFLDTQARTVEICALFYSIEFGITTDLRILFDLTGGRVRGTHKIAHYVAATGSDLRDFLVFQFAGVANLLIFVADTIRGLRALRSDSRELGYVDRSSATGLALNVIVIVSMAILTAFVVPFRVQSSSKTEELIGKVVLLPWDDPNVKYSKKKEVFLRTFEEVAALVKEFLQIEYVGMGITIMLLLRMVLATSIHPRIALMTATLKEGFSEMFHFSLIFMIIFWNFGRIAEWRYGVDRSDLSTTLKAMASQFDTILDPPGSLAVSEDNLDTDYVVFALFFHGICFFFLVNFILAIIVNAYTTVIDHVNECEVEQDIVSDLWALFATECKRCKHRWPAKVRLMSYLGHLDLTFLNPRDLKGCEGFGNEQDIQAFYDYYKRFGFLYFQGGEGVDLNVDERREHMVKGLEGNVMLCQRKTDQLKNHLDHEVCEIKRQINTLSEGVHEMGCTMKEVFRAIGSITGEVRSASSNPPDGLAHQADQRTKWRIRSISPSSSTPNPVTATNSGSSRTW